MQPITSLDQLEALYGPPIPSALAKVATQLTPLYQQWISAARFVVVATTGPEGTDVSPRGDMGPVVRIVDATTLWLPDWMGNNRIDSLRNIIRDGRISLMFMVPGCANVVRINGTAIVTTDTRAVTSFTQSGKHPRSVILITVAEAYFQCAKALMRSALWTSGDQSQSVPSAGQFLTEAKAMAQTEAAAYDKGYAEYAKDRMW